MEEATKEDAMFPFDTYDTYDWYLNLGPLSNANEKYFHGKLPSWNDFVKHPNYDEFWQKQSMPYRLGAPTVPDLHVAGWWDQEDFYGPLKAYEVLEKKRYRTQKFHRDWSMEPWRLGPTGKKESLGNIKFGTPTAEKIPQGNTSAMVCILFERKRRRKICGGCNISDRFQHLEDV